MLYLLERMMWTDWGGLEEEVIQLGGYAGGGSYYGGRYHFDYLSELSISSTIIRKLFGLFPITSSIEKPFFDSVGISSSLQFPFLDVFGISSTIEKEYLKTAAVDSSGIHALLNMIHHIESINSTKAFPGIQRGLFIDDIRHMFAVKTANDIENVKKPDSIDIIGNKNSINRIRSLRHAE